jgi:hypothetical protein
MNDPTPAASPIAQSVPSRAVLDIRMGFSPRANVALSFLRSLEWLRTRLPAIFSRSMPVKASSLASPGYGRRQAS